MCRHTESDHRPRDERSGNDTATSSVQNRGNNGHTGHRIRTKKKKNRVRILLANVNGIGIEEGGNKDASILEFTNRFKVDVVGITEPNVHWGKVKQKDHFKERTSGWYESMKSSLAYNVRRNRTRSRRSQAGGTITYARDGISHRCFSQGRDETGLGRWSWLRFRGKQHSVTRVVTVYCPVKSHGPNTVYSQHLEHLGRDPLAAFWEDLSDAVEQWQSLGDRLVIMGDWNYNVQSAQFVDWCEAHDLHNGLSSMYGTDSPATYNSGTKTIDAILLSNDLDGNRGGYLDFGHVPGDHRGLWIDLYVEEFIGYNPPPVVNSKARRLKMDDPQVVARYNEILDGYLHHHGLYHRMHRLMEDVGDNEFTTGQAKEFEAIDKLSCTGMLIAERKCRKLKMGGVKWSPTIQKARDTILLWTLVQRRLKGRKVGARRIVRLKKKLSIQHTAVTLREAEPLLSAAYTTYKAAKKAAESLSIAFRERLAQRKASAGKLSAANHLRQMNTIEQQRTTSRRVKNALKKGQRQSTSKIQVEVDGKLVDVTEKEGMEDHIMPENESKFHQTQHTPLLHDDVIRDIGLMGDGPEVDSILDGTYEPPPSCSWATKRWLQQMTVHDNRQRTEILTTLSDFRKGWKMVKEKTSSGIHHFGHFKSGCLHKKIGWFLFLRSVLPYNRGYSPSRWQQGTDVMILKKEELYLLTKLRTIVLYEADYNHENKRLGRDSMTMALLQNRVAPEQFCRPGRSAQDNAYCKRQAFDYARFKKRPFAFGASDLASCYDRIVHNAASLALQNIGMCRRKIRSMFGTIQRLTHRVRTLFGDSKKTFGGDPKRYFRPPQGTGQGNGAAPSIWTILSSTIFDILHDEGYSTKFIFGISLGLFHLCGFSYVDDCDLLMTGDCPYQLAEEFQDLLKVWDELMEVTGAALAPDKCWWYLIDFEWKNGLWRMTNPDEDFCLRARNKKGELVTLTRMKGHEAKEMVGVHLAPDGNQKTQIKVLRSKSQEWAKNISNSHLSPHETWTAMTTSAIKSLQYPLCASTIQQEDMTGIMAPILKTGLPRSGYASNFPRAVLYGPTSMQGVGMTDPYLYQYCRHIRDIISGGWKNDLNGKFTKANIEATLLECGIFGPLFLYDKDIRWFNTTNSMIIETWQFCYKYGITFDERFGSLGPRRSGDRSIMEEISTLSYTNAELRRINRCRLYFGVVSISDITTSDGKRLCDELYSKQHFHRSNSYDWPNQQRPPPRDMKLWINAIECAFAPIGGILQRPLGSWFVTEKEFFRDWEWFVTDSGGLYRKRGQQWYAARELEQDRTTRQLVYNGDISTHIKLHRQPQRALHRTTIGIHSGKSIVAHGISSHTPPPSITYSTTMASIQTCMDEHDEASWTFFHRSFHAPLDEIYSLLYSSKCMVISDGSYYPRERVGAMAWCLGTHEGQLLAEGGGPIPGHVDDQSPYRSECGGLLGGISFVECMETVNPPSREYTLQIGCDGEAALYKSVTEPKDKVSTSQRQIDIISRVQDSCSALQAHLRSKHVLGHQEKLGKKLTVDEMFNERMDKLAKIIGNHFRGHDIPRPAHLPPSTRGAPQIQVQGKTITSDIDTSIIDRISYQRLLNWWCNRSEQSKNRFKASIIPLVDWNVVQVCTKRLCRMPRWRRFIPKWISGHIAVGTTMARRVGRFSNRCPRCGFHLEDTTHVIRCKDSKTGNPWKKGLAKLGTWMDKMKTYPHLKDGILLVLKEWFIRPHTLVPSYCDESVTHVFEAQSRIGWKHFLEGLLSPAWGICQQEYYNQGSTLRTGKQWAIGLSRELWTLVFSIWDHRNKVLHSKSVSDDLHGIGEIKRAAIRELTLGTTGGLDPVFDTYLSISVEELVKYDSISLRNWLCIVRRAREATGYVYLDTLADDDALRQWTGLPKK